MISTRDLAGLPDLDGFRRITRSLAMLDAILSPEWEYRYYSFDSHWDSDVMMASMRNGSGDGWFAVLAPYGVALHGLAHEAPTFQPDSPAPEIFAQLPAEFHASLLHEPAFDTANSTFCIWRCTRDGRWHSGEPPLHPGEDPDGSRELLSILEGRPEQYVAFAAEYYERRIAVEDVASVYRHQPLTAALVRRLNSGISLESLTADADGIGYPEAVGPARS